MMIRNSKCNNHNRRSFGMTLIELLIAVVIIGVLSAIAYPSYTKHVLKGHRTIALADMGRIQLELEHHYDKGYDWSRIISGGNCVICESDAERYQFSVASSATSSYTITATAQSTRGQDKDECLTSDKVMTLKSTNESAPSACWK
ncbi:prepilin-type N-terminal cleavage/methylation domain-containing protein [Vibrio anguillarum]|nr:prepilin-type cleavage/methylation domain-containing protein [Vibrio anguillarum]MBF4251020.1 prepilin-type N-terminal cleavage/methylation domain-containing protein [Vibrio anguillarum]MBF4388066.1 prepilin-type N-terminal cleavage/methylation domain-containing protein [Vibrio anguillarum]MBF4402380.1 prepilin-type N-terminal cleavage/methylation domain-containing protein [Vibrio anguillarum]